MADKIDISTVKHIALLSRLELSGGEIGTYSGQLAAILDYIDKLNQLDTKDTPATSHVLADLKNVYRSDTVKKSLDVENALKNAPEKAGDFFKIPRVIEGK